jgi:hypothetical protein
MAKRGSRFDRRKTKKPNIVVQPRDEEIFKALYEYRFLDIDHICFLTESPQYVVSRRLTNLYRCGYLDRPAKQAFLYRPINKIVYALGDRGAEHLSLSSGIDRGKINWRTKNIKVKDTHIQHTLMIATFKIILDYILKQTPDTELLFWKYGSRNELLDKITLTDGTELTINPDAFFGTKSPRGKKFFFLEADRSNIDNERYLKRMKSYFHYWDQDRHKEKYHIKYFTVLTITKSQEKANNLRKISKKADTYKKGFTGFWFTTEKNYKLEDPQMILEPIWQAPADDTYHSLLE